MMMRSAVTVFYKNKPNPQTNPWCWCSSSTNLLPVKGTATAFIVPQSLFVQILEVYKYVSPHFILLLGFLEVVFILFVCYLFVWLFFGGWWFLFWHQKQEKTFSEKEQALWSYFSLLFFCPVLRKLGRILKGNMHGVAIWEWDASRHPADMGHVRLYLNARMVSSSQSLCKVNDQDWNSGKQRHAKHFIGQLQLPFLPTWSMSFPWQMEKLCHSDNQNR